METTLLGQKKALRQHIAELRRQMTEHERGEKSFAICENLLAHHLLLNQQAPFTIFTYIPWRAEVDIHPFIQRCWERNIRVIAPKIISDGNRLRLHVIQSYNDIETGAWGIREPKDDTEVCSDISQIDIILVPGVAFDHYGGRLGSGGGYYDRFAAQYDELGLAHPLKLAVAFEIQVVNDIPMEPHDLRVNELITEKGCFTSCMKVN